MRSSVMAFALAALVFALSAFGPTSSISGGFVQALSYDGINNGANSAGLSCGVTGLGAQTSDASFDVVAKIVLGRTGVVQAVVGKHAGTFATANYILYVDASNHFGMEVGVDGSTVVDALGTTTLLANVPYTVEGGWNGSNLFLKVNQVAEGTTPAVSTLQAPDGTTPFMVAREGFGGSIFPLKGTVANVSVTIGGTLRGYWPSSTVSNAGTTPDTSGNGRTCTFVGTPVSVLSPFSTQALTYDGVDRDNNSASLNCGTAGFGLSTADGYAQVNATIRRSRTGVVEIIGGKFEDVHSQNWNYLLYVDVSNHLEFVVLNSAQGLVSAVGTTSLNANVNYNVEGDWTGTAVQVKVNGTQEGTTPSVTALQSPDSITPFFVGRTGATNSGDAEPYPFQGVIANMGVTIGGTQRALLPIATDVSGNGRNCAFAGTNPPSIGASPF